MQKTSKHSLSRTRQPPARAQAMTQANPRVWYHCCIDQAVTSPSLGLLNRSSRSLVSDEGHGRAVARDVTKGHEKSAEVTEFREAYRSISHNANFRGSLTPFGIH